MKEIWKDVPMYEGIYEVSNLGRVKSKTTGQLSTLCKNKKGYLIAKIYLNGQVKNERVHRLVAMTFIPNPDNLPQVNHIDECKTNNCVDNLEWCTCEYNVDYGTHSNHCKKVEIDGVVFSSINKCAKYLGIPHGTLSGYLKEGHYMPEEFVMRNLKYAENS
jgi:hypothetical protein